MNIIIENLKTKLGLPKPRPTPYHLKMADQSMTKPLGIIINLKIHILGVTTLALSLRPRQGFTKVWAKSWTLEVTVMLLGV